MLLFPTFHSINISLRTCISSYLYGCIKTYITLDFRIKRVHFNLLEYFFHKYIIQLEFPFGIITHKLHTFAIIKLTLFFKVNVVLLNLRLLLWQLKDYVSSSQITKLEELI